MKRFLTAVFAVFAATLPHFAENILEKGFSYLGEVSPIARRYIMPQHIVAMPDSLCNGISNAATLLAPFRGQLTIAGEADCTLSTLNGNRASVLLDFGRELHGSLEIATGMRHSKNARVRIRLGESVSEAMSDTGGSTPMSSATNDQAMRDFEVEVPWLGTIETGNSGFRFARIDLLGENAELDLRAVRAVLKYRDIPYLGSFRCSDARLDSIWATAAYTVHLNMQDYLWDGIKRDRLVWLGDMHPEAMTILSVFGNNEVLGKSLDLGRDTTPLPGWMNGIAAYSMWWILIHRDLYLYTGDIATLAAQQEYMLGLLDLLAGKIEGNSENLDGDIRLLDWPTSRMPEAVHAGYQALMVMSCKAAQQIGAWLGNKPMRKKADAMLKRLEKHVPPHIGNKQAASLLALAGMIKPDDVGKDVIAKGGADGFSTFYGYYMLEALAKAGLYDDALKIISDYWGGMLDLGATSFWEDFDYSLAKKAARIDRPVPAGKFDIHAESGDFCYKGLRHSLCHGWASGPAPWLSRHVLGIEPLEPGFRKVAVKPHLGSLEWAEGSFPTPLGVISVRHEKRPDGSVASTIDAPDGIEIVTDK